MAKTFDQAAVVPLKDGLVGMVTSSTGKRWVVPKGHIDPGHTAREAASIEAWEEAGWLGMLGVEPIGFYTYRKDGRERNVLVFLMNVTDERDQWPEASIRCREWLSVEDAVQRIGEPGLQAIVAQLGVDTAAARAVG